MEKTASKKTAEKSKPQAEISYDQAFERLQEIVSDMESENVTVDRLTLQLKEAVGLLAVCKAKLRSTEAEVDEILKNLNGKS